MGVSAVKNILDGKQNRIIVVKNGVVKDIDLDEGLNMTKGILTDFLDTVEGVESK